MKMIIGSCVARVVISNTSLGDRRRWNKETVAQCCCVTTHWELRSAELDPSLNQELGPKDGLEATIHDCKF